MSTIAFVCLAVVCVALGILNTIFNKLVGWKGIVIRGLFIFSLITFTLITSNLTGVNNALPLFVTLALALLLLADVTYVAMSDEDKYKPVINGGFLSASCILFALSAVSLAEFALLAFLGGLFAGLGIGLVVCAVKKQKGVKNVLMNILTFACIGLFIGLSVNAVSCFKTFNQLNLCACWSGSILNRKNCCELWEGENCKLFGKSFVHNCFNSNYIINIFLLKLKNFQKKY